MPDPGEPTDSDRPSRTVVVAGDVTVDWNLARRSLAADGGAVPGARASWQRGGSALLADLIAATAARLERDQGSVTVRAGAAPTPPVPPGNADLNQSYAVWDRVPRSADGDESDRVWRVSAALGVDRARSEDTTRGEWDRLRAEVPDADVIVLDDADLGFREGSDSGLWEAMRSDRRPWVVLKQARPVARGPLWDHLLATCADRLIVVLTIDDLRGREVQVSRALSWERTAQELRWELVNKPDVNALSRVAHTVVTFGPAGAVHLAGGDADQVCTLHYDPALVEGGWETTHPGHVIGGTGCLTAAVVRELLLDPDQPDVGHGIETGVAAARRLHLDGYEEVGTGRMELGFPLAAVVETMAGDESPTYAVRVPEPGGEVPWTILQDRCTGGLADLASEIARNGAKAALAGVPLGRFANLVTADRSEIEAFRGIAGLIADYAEDPPSRPLAIGVFGPPGSGKSFGVKQVAAAVAGGRISRPLEFNLSQLDSPEDLIDAFHLVRDKGLAGEIPLVFWDEFDTPLDGPLGWLRYFLAPMQDGEFRQGQVTHPIGSSIFVFAGGTCARMADFGRDLVVGSGDDEDDSALRQAKGPDFVSRLKGFVDVLGPNPQGEDDPYYVIRRAILLRSVLERNAGHLFAGDRLRIDPGVLRAFLETTEFRHGARSLEAVVATSSLAGKSAYERSSLPSASQLALHVDAEDFLALVQRLELTGDLLENLAQAAHEVFRTAMVADGYTYAKVPDAEHKKSDSLVDYDDLGPLKQEENRANVRDIPAKLDTVGCLMVPAATEPVPASLTDDEIEELSEEEHERWMRDLGPGWRYGRPTDKERKVHEAYLPWNDLPEEQKEKDRNLVREIPTILARAGYVIVRARRPDEESA